jgi:hypothetical protein
MILGESSGELFTLLETLNYVCNHPEVNVGTPLKIRVTGLPAIEDVDAIWPP